MGTQQIDPPPRENRNPSNAGVISLILGVAAIAVGVAGFMGLRLLFAGKIGPRGEESLQWVFMFLLMLGASGLLSILGIVAAGVGLARSGAGRPAVYGLIINALVLVVLFALSQLLR